MNARITELTAMIRRLEEDLETEFAWRRLQLAYTVHDGKVRFEEHALIFHRKIRTHVLSYMEQYWCPIKHARRVLGAHERYSLFADYGDAGSYSKDLIALRDALRREKDLT